MSKLSTSGDLASCDDNQDGLAIGFDTTSPAEESPTKSDASVSGSDSTSDRKSAIRYAAMAFGAIVAMVLLLELSGQAKVLTQQLRDGVPAEDAIFDDRRAIPATPAPAQFLNPTFDLLTQPTLGKR